LYISLAPAFSGVDGSIGEINKVSGMLKQIGTDEVFLNTYCAWLICMAMVKLYRHLLVILVQCSTFDMKMAGEQCTAFLKLIRRVILLKITP
jgi:hypothetical protein